MARSQPQVTASSTSPKMCGPSRSVASKSHDHALCPRARKASRTTPENSQPTRTLTYPSVLWIARVGDAGDLHAAAHWTVVHTDRLTAQRFWILGTLHFGRLMPHYPTPYGQQALRWRLLGHPTHPSGQ